jgi:citrate lyase beta subunit
VKIEPCLFYVPAARVDTLLKNVPRRSCTLVLDLEDSVPKHLKPTAREKLARADLSGTGLAGVAIRVNSIETPDGLLDLQTIFELGGEIGGLPVEIVLVPKVAAGRDVAIYRSLLSRLPDPPEIYSFIETLDAVEHAFDIAAASEGLCFGQADLVAEMWAPDESFLAHARARMCVAASRHGLPVVDTNSFELWDMDVVRAQCEAAKRCGFTAKAAIHPKQVDAIVQTFTVAPEELDGYRQTIKDYEANEAGFAVSRDRVLAPPFVLKARRMLALHDQPATMEDIVPKSITGIVRQAMVDVAGYDVDLADGRFGPVPAGLTRHLEKLVADGAGLAVCHGAGALLAKHGLDIHDEADAAVARDYLEAIFRAFTAEVDLARHTPVVMGYDQVASMDVDGFNKNTSFTPNSEHTESREFLTTKCVHFDAATTFIGNVYGPNTNITGGLPIVADTREYCRDSGLDPAELIELMPHSYNVAVKPEHAEAILADYAVAVDVDLDNDMVMIVLNNEVAGGLAHAGSTPRLTDPAKPGKRPLRHIELQFADGANLNNWYRHYRLEMPEVKVKVPDVNTPDHDRYHRGVDTALAAQSPAVGN